MIKRLRLDSTTWAGGLLLGLLGLLLAGCGSGTASASNSATATATCPPPTGQQFSQSVGLVTAASSTQVTIKNLLGTSVTLQLTSQTRYIRQQTAALSDVQDGKTVQIIAKQNTDGSYTAQTVVIAYRPAGTGTGGNGGNGGTGGNGSNGGNRECRLRGTVTPGAGGFGGGQGGQGKLPNGERLVAGTVSTTSSQSITVTTRAGQDLTITVDSSTVYSTIAQAQASDVKIGAAVQAQGRKNTDGTITAVNISILLKLPTTSANP